MQLIRFLALTVAAGLELFKPESKETNHLLVNLMETSKIRFQKGENYTFYVGGGLRARKYGSEFYVDKWKCGVGIINQRFVENVNYSFTFEIRNLLPQHVVCVGIASEGFLVQEVLQFDGYDSQCTSKFQKGFCSDNRRSYLYKDMYTNYNEFDEQDYIDQGLFNLGDVSEDNMFESEGIQMNLQGNTLMFIDEEHEYLSQQNYSKLLASFDKIDRKRVYMPMFLIRKITNDQYLKPPRKRKVPKPPVDTSPVECVRPVQSYEEVVEDTQMQKEVKADQVGQSAIQELVEIEQFEEKVAQEDFFSFVQLPDWVDILIKPFTKVEDKKVSPPKKVEIIEEETVEEEDVNWSDKYLSIFWVKDIQAHALTSIPQYDKQILPLRDSISYAENNTYIVQQNNLLLSTPLQQYESCSYAFLDIPPFSLSSNIFMQVSIVQLDFTSGVYPIGVGIFATEMLDQFRGWRNAQSQIWCLDSHLLQYGALYRTDGTFYDSQIMGEYNKYSNQQATNRQGTITMYFTRGNRLVYRIGKDKKLFITCVNSRFRYFTPIFELKAWKGKPVLRLDEFENHHAMPFEFSDSDKNLFENFGRSTKWIFLSKFFTEKRGNFVEEDDDYTLSSFNGTSSMNMWETSLYLEQYEWYVRIDSVDLTPGGPIQICLGVHQIGQESLIEQILLKRYQAQVAYICDKNDYAHTFFEECPVYENNITLIPGSVIRIRQSNFLMEFFDGYNTVFLSLRRAGNTAVVPSVVLRGTKNKVTFLKQIQKQGPNPVEWRVKDLDDLMNFQNFVSYDVFSLPIFKWSESKKIKFCWNDEQKQAIALVNQNSSKSEEKPKKNTNKQREQILLTENGAIGGLKSQVKSRQMTVPQEISFDQGIESDLEKYEPCLILYDYCDYKGPNVVICGDHSPQEHLLQFQSCKLNKEGLQVTLEKKTQNVPERILVNQNIECLASPVSLQGVSFTFVL